MQYALSHFHPLWYLLASPSEWLNNASCLSLPCNVLLFPPISSLYLLVFVNRLPLRLLFPSFLLASSLTIWFLWVGCCWLYSSPFTPFPLPLFNLPLPITSISSLSLLLSGWPVGQFGIYCSNEGREREGIPTLGDRYIGWWRVGRGGRERGTRPMPSLSSFTPLFTLYFTLPSLFFSLTNTRNFPCFIAIVLSIISLLLTHLNQPLPPASPSIVSYYVPNLYLLNRCNGMGRERSSLSLSRIDRSASLPL